MKKNVKNSLLLLTLLMILILSISSTFAQDLDDSANDLAVDNDDGSISIENQNIGYEEISNVNDDISTADTVSTVDDDVYTTDTTSAVEEKYVADTVAEVNEETTDIVSAVNDEPKVSAGETTAPMPEVDTGVVSGNADFTSVNPWSTSGSLTYTVPDGMTNLKSAIVVVNVYSGSGANTYALYSNVSLSTKNGLEELGYEALAFDQSTGGDSNVYVINDHSTKQYSDYQMVYDITNKVNSLSSGDTITINVVDSAYPNKQFDGKIKLISLLYAYDDGDDDNYTYWFHVGQLWTMDTANFNFNTEGYSGKTNNVSLRSIALSSTPASSTKINNAEVVPDSTISGNYYLDIKWDNVGPRFNAGSKTNFWAQSGGASYKTNVALLIAAEPETVEPLTEVFVDYANGNDNNMGTTINTAFKTISHALSVIEANGIINVNGVNYLDDAGVDGINIDKNISIIGLGDGATIDANNVGRIFYITANSVSLSNLAFVNANVASASDKRGGALWVQGTTLTVDNCKFINNTAGASSSYGGAINLKSTSATIKDSYFENNSAFYAGAGINAESSNVLLNISNCIFTLNEVLNTGWATGGAICSYNTVIIEGSAFYGNKLAEGKNGRSINQYGTGSLTITDSILLDGANSVYIASGPTTLENNWWGNNDTTATTNPKDLGYTNANVGSYLYLNMTGFASGMEVGDTATININLVSTGDETVNVMNLPATLTAVNGDIVPTETELVNGAGTATYTITTAGDNTITVNVLGIEDTVSLDSGDVISTEVIYVNSTGGSDSNAGDSWERAVQTIEKAIGLVDDNGTIYVADGFYPLAGSTPAAGISITKNIAIIGESVNAIISGNDEKRIFTISKTSQLTICNLTLTNGRATGYGGAIQIEDGGNTNPVVAGKLIISDSIISDCYASSGGGAIGAYRGSVDSVNNVTFIRDGSGDSGGAIFDLQKGNLTVGDNNKFIECYSNNRGSALYGQVNVTVGKNNLFYGNMARGSYGYGAIYGYGIILGTGNVFVNNYAQGTGATIYAGGRAANTASGSYCIFINNTAGDGTTVSSQQNNRITLENCYWGTNTPDFAAICNKNNFIHNTYLVLDLSAEGNAVAGEPIAINVDLTKNQNGATIDINSLPNTLPLTFTVENGNVNPLETELVSGVATTTYTPAVMGEGSITANIYAPVETLTLNVAPEAGTVFVNYTGGLDTNDGGNWDSAVKTLSHALEIVGEGKTIYMADGVHFLDGATADGLTINKNISIVGMGDNIVIDANNNGRIFNIGAYTVDLSNLAFINGNASTTTEKRGGALYVNGATLTIDNCKFINNTAGTRADAGDTSTYAGAINLKSSTTTITNSEFDGNTAWSTGAGINAENTNVLLNISNSTFTNNVILNNGWSAGAAICAYNTVTIDRSIFYGNRLTDESRNGKTINEYGDGSLTITNSILLDGEKGVWIATGTTVLDNNWWGNNNATADTNPKDLGYTNADVSTYLVLSSSINTENVYQGDSVTVTTTLTGNEIELPIVLSANVGTITPHETIITDSEVSTYDATDLGDVEITVDVLGIKNIITLTVKETLPDVTISNVKTPWADGIYPGVNNTFNITLSNNGDTAVEGLVLEVYSNETGELIASYTFESLASGTSSILITDPAIRAITEDTIWPAAKNNKIKFTFNLMRGNDLVSTLSVDKMLAYDGYLNKTYAYGGHDNIINRNYTITGDLIIATQDVSVYMDQYSRFRNESWNIETPEGAEIVKVFLYFNYNWDTSFFPNGWSLTFNDADILNEYISYETDRGNLGAWGAYNYGLLVFDVTDYYKVNDINNFVIEKTGNCALYPSTLYVLYNQTGSDSYKDIYFSDICDVYYPNYNMNGYDDLLKTVVNYNGINVENLADATLYVFSGSSSANNNLSFNEGLVVNPFNGHTSNDCRPYAYNVSGLIGTDNEAWFITGATSSTTVAFEQVLVVERMKNEPYIEVANSTANMDVGDEFDIGAVLIPNVGDLTYTSSDESIATVENGKITAIAPGEAIITISFAGNEEYRSTNATVIVTVNRMAGVQVDANAADYALGETGSLVITVTDVDGNALNGAAYVEIDGEIYELDIEVTNGQATVDLIGLDVGKHVAKVTFDNPNYLTVDYTTHFNVTKAIPVITVTGAEIELEDVATVNVTVMAGETPVSGYAMVTVNGVSYAVTIGQDGKGFVDIENLPFGEYPITAKFLGNDNYAAVDFTGNAKVIVTSDEVTFDLSVDDDNTEITISNAKDAAGEPVDGYIMGELFKDGSKVQDLDFAMLEEGDGTISIPEGLLPGTYTAMITIMTYESAFASDEITFTIEPMSGAQVDANAVDYAFGETGSLVITVTDADGNALNGAAYVEIDDEIYELDIEVTNGQATIDLSNLAVGAHAAKVTFDNPNYLTVDYTTHFNVTKAIPVVEVNDTEAEWNTAFDIPVKVSDENGNPVTGTVIVTVDWIVDGKSYVVELDENGMGTANFIINEAIDDLTITARYMGNDNFVAKNATAALTITDSTDLELEVIANEPEFGEDTIITVTGKNGRGADVPIDAVNVTIDGVTTEYTVAADGTVNLGQLSSGDTEITVSVDDGVHDEATETITVSVKPGFANVDVEKLETEVGQYPKIKVNVTDANGDPVTGRVYVSVNGEGLNPLGIQLAEDGTAIVEIPVSEVGNYYVDVVFAGPDYEEASDSTVVTITKVTPIMTVTGSTVEYGEPSTVDIKVTDENGNPVTGTVIVEVDWQDDVAYDVVELDENGEGQATFRLDLLGVMPGTFDVTTNFIGDDKYDSVENTDANVTITESTELIIDVSVNDPSEGEDVIITIIATDGTGAEVPVAAVNVTIDGVTTEYPLEEDGTVNIGELPAGETEVTISVDDGVHTPVNETITVNVNLPENLDTILTVITTDISYGDKAVIEFTLTDINDNPITGEIYVTVGDHEETVYVNGGFGSVTIENLTADTYPVVANFDGDENYSPSVGTDYFNVAKNATVIVYSDMETTAVYTPVDGRIGEYFNVVLTDANGNPLADQFIQIGFNGKIYNKTTNATGGAQLQINLAKVDRYTFAICYLGDENHNASFAVAKIDVVAQTPKLTVPNKSYSASAKTKTLTATFKTSKGNAVSGKKVTFTVNGKTYSAKTNSNGVASVNVSLTTKGTYTVTTKFEGDTTYAAVTKTSTLKLT